MGDRGARRDDGGGCGAERGGSVAEGSGKHQSLAHSVVTDEGMPVQPLHDTLPGRICRVN